MDELLRTTDAVLLNWVKSVLKDQGIQSFEMDRHMSILEGSIGALVPRRLMVESHHVARARSILVDAGLSKHMQVKD
ncbi:MAG: DUF2007 domain-containing protein [Sphingomonadales bacterium]